MQIFFTEKGIFNIFYKIIHDNDLDISKIELKAYIKTFTYHETSIRQKLDLNKMYNCKYFLN